jgi:hypothetical protein
VNSHFRSGPQTTSISLRSFSWWAIAVIANLSNSEPNFQRYLWDLPEPLFVLSLKDYRNYKQIRSEWDEYSRTFRFHNLMSCIAKYAENDFSLLRTKIRELHPVHRASLGALLRHLLLVASHSDNNDMTVEKLAANFRQVVLRGNEVRQDGVYIKVIYASSTSFTFFQLISLEGLVLEDLIRNVHTLFDDQPSTSLPVPSPAAETTSTFPSGSFLSTELPRPSEVDAIVGSGTGRPGLVSVTRTLAHSSFSSLPSDVALASRLAPSQTGPQLGLSSSNILVEGVETNSQEQVTHEVRGTEAMEPEALANRPPPEVVSLPPTSVTEWRLRQSQLPSHPEAVTTPQSPPESVLSCTSDLALSSVTSL